MDFDVDIQTLSAKFVQDYPPTSFPELMHKSGRPYVCLLIDTHEDYLICIPFRSSINHNNAFLFKGTVRSQKSRSGLDYSKIIIIKDSAYLDKSSVVDQDEYKEAITNMNKIVSESSEYINNYIHHIEGSKKLHEREYVRKYNYSTLRYFHKELGIHESQ